MTDRAWAILDLDELTEPGVDGRLTAVGVDRRDCLLFLLVWGAFPRRQHHTKLEPPGLPLTWCAPTPSGLEVMAASTVWSAWELVTGTLLPVAPSSPGALSMET